jgi:hypothetical protein
MRDGLAEVVETLDGPVVAATVIDGWVESG